MGLTHAVGGFSPPFALTENVGLPHIPHMDIKQIIRSSGGPSKIGKEISRHHTTVLKWERVPAEHVLAVSRLSGIPVWKIRPDVFPAPISAGAVDAPENGTGEAA